MITTADAQHAALTNYDCQGTATRLAGEYDHNFYISAADGSDYLLKISHHDTPADIIDLQNTVLQHLKQQESFKVPELVPTLSGRLTTQLNGHQSNIVRLFHFLEGTLFAESESHSNELLSSLGQQLGRLSAAMQELTHPAAERAYKWDLMQAEWINDHLQIIENSDDRNIIEKFLAIYQSTTLPALSRLRKSIIHGDLNDYNIIVNDNAVLGFIDFGDLVQSATICELAIALAYAIMRKPDPLAAACTVIQSYHAEFPLEHNELDVLFNLITIRLCVSVINSAIRKQSEPDNAYLTISEQPAWDLLRHLNTIDANGARSVFLRICGHQDTNQQHWDKPHIANVRAKYLGKNVGLSYNSPLLIVRGEGQYLYDENGREYLDCVNNVCHVGHCHPQVVAAGQHQMAVLNTNTRYLHENLSRYAERLLSTLPEPLEVCFFACSGSEANELALRLARTHTRRKNITVLDQGYHGNTTTLIEISPYKFNSRGGSGKPDYVQVLPLPDLLRGINLRSEMQIQSDIAAFICEALPSCAGQIVLPNGYLRAVYHAVRHAGGVCIADEVQIGLGRVGTHFWGFETQDVIPDIVTMGKPLGNGHPLAAVVTTREIADSFCNGMEYFNSFGGNPVSCAIGLSVLDVIDQEKLQEHARVTGDYLLRQLHHLQQKYDVIGDVRGTGLFIGIELVTDRSTLTPNGPLTAALVNDMKDRGILLSSDGPGRNVIKIKPPMVFSKDNCDLLIDCLDKSLAHNLSS